MLEVSLHALSNPVAKYTHWLRIKAPSIKERVPVHIVATIDTSGSMNEKNKLNNVKKTLTAVLDILMPTDLFSLVVFSNSSRILISKELMTIENKYKAQTMIDSMVADYSTNLSAGILNAFKCIGDDLKYKTSILLLTDGEANRGITIPFAIMDMIGNHIRTTIHTVGYGFDHNSELMNMISQEYSGTYSAVDNLEDVAACIGTIFGNIACCVAQNISVESSDMSFMVSGYPTMKDGIHIGDITAEADIGILVTKNENTKFNVNGYYIHGGIGPISIDVDVVVNATDEINRVARITLHRLKLAEYMKTNPGLEVLEEFEKEMLANEASDLLSIMLKQLEELKIYGQSFEERNLQNETINLNNIGFFTQLRSIYIEPTPQRPGVTTHTDDPRDVISRIIGSPMVNRYTQDIISRVTQADMCVDDVD